MIGGRSTKCPRGVSLLEVVVTLGLFLVIMTALLSIFSYTLRVQRRALAMQATFDATRGTLEAMARAIRQADPHAVTTVGYCDVAQTCLEFHHIEASENFPGDDTGVVRYRLENGAIQVLNSHTGGVYVNVTSDDVVVEQLQFYVSGEQDDDTLQPLVAIAVTVKSAADPDRAIHLQTSASVRTLQE